MSAAVHRARDVSPVLERLITIEIGDRAIQATVKYRVSYASVWHRGHGMDPDIDVLAITYEDGTEVRSLPMRPELHDAIVDWIEADELELN